MNRQESTMMLGTAKKINRGRFFLFAALGLLLAGICSADPGRPMNLLFITLDTVRADHLGPYDYYRATPALDMLAEEATVFQDVTCSMPTTLPSHLTIFTGLTPNQHGITENGMGPLGHQDSVFSLLGEQGLLSAAVISARVLDREYLSGIGIEHFFFGDGRDPDADQLPGDAVTNMAQKWLSIFGQRPFALWLHYFDAHEPYTPPPDYLGCFRGPYQGFLDDFMSGELETALNHEPGVAAALTAEDRQHLINLYDAELAFLDHQLGTLFLTLQELGLWDKTLIVVVGDHGQAHGEQEYWGHGGRLLEPIIKVPLIIRLPGQRDRLRVGSAVETLDIMPTLAELFGFTPGPELSGRSLVPALLGEPISPGRFRIIQRRTYWNRPDRQGIAVHGGDWKLTQLRDGQGDSFHLGRSEGNGGIDGENLYQPGCEEARRFRSILKDWRSHDWQPSSPETIEMLRALGYVGPDSAGSH